MTNIVEFVDARLSEEADAANAMPNPEKHRRTVDALRTVAGQIVAHLEANDVEDPTDHPVAAGLLVVAQVWSDHPDFQPRTVWFPKMSKVRQR
jgi:hypothetical protein